MPPRHVLFLLLAGCAPATVVPETGDALLGIDVGATDLHQADGLIDAWDGVWSGPMLQVVAVDAASAAWSREDVHGTLTLDNTSSLYLFGDIADVDTFIRGGAPAAPLAGVVLDAQGECLALVPALAVARDEGPAILAEGALTLGARSFDAAPCAADEVDVADVRARAGLLSVEAQDPPLPESGEAPPPSCGSSCGSSEGYSYAGETAYSNGSTTGSGSSCGGTDTYGYRWQCVQYTERVHHRSDWAGNAYTGYWSNTGLSSGTQGPYYKGLLPLGSGRGMLAPQAGDVVVWYGGTYGHVAIIASVGSSTVTVYDQNRRCGDQSCTLTYGSSYTLGNGSGTGYCGSESMTYTLKGYLHRGWDFGGTYGLASSSSTSSSTHNWYLNDASYYASTTSGSVEDITDYITLNPGTSDPYMVSPSGLALPAYSSSATYGYRYVSFYIQSNCTNKNAQLFWKRTTDSGFDASRSVSATISGTGWQSLTFNPSTSSSWSGTIDQIRLDPASGCSSGSTDTISLQSAWIWR